MTDKKDTPDNDGHPRYLRGVIPLDQLYTAEGLAWFLNRSPRVVKDRLLNGDNEGATVDEDGCPDGVPVVELCEGLILCHPEHLAEWVRRHAKPRTQKPKKGARKKCQGKRAR